jgi:hypothetical protein
MFGTWTCSYADYLRTVPDDVVTLPDAQVAFFPGPLGGFTCGDALYGLPDDYFSQFVPRISAIDSSEVTRVAREHLDPSRLLTVVVGDRDKIGASLARLDLGASELAVT